MQPVISFTDVAKQYNGREVLSSLSFTINKGDVVGILGPSGMGKTTILKLVSGLEKPSFGKVQINGAQIGYVFQEPRLFPWKTALENVVLPLKANGIAKGKRICIGTHYLEVMGLAKFADYYPSQLSGGMKQRVSLARAFAIKPDVLLLDEPFSALDIKLRDYLLSMISDQLKHHPMTLLYVSHSPKELARIATRAFIMHSGHEMSEISVSECETMESDSDELFSSRSVTTNPEEGKCTTCTC